MKNVDWMEKSNCLGYEVNKFYDDFEQMTVNERIKILQICADCSVRKECYNYAASNPNSYGLMGGVFWKDGKPKNALRIKKRNVKELLYA